MPRVPRQSTIQRHTGAPWLCKPPPEPFRILPPFYEQTKPFQIANTHTKSASRFTVEGGSSPILPPACKTGIQTYSVLFSNMKLAFPPVSPSHHTLHSKTPSSPPPKTFTPPSKLLNIFEEIMPTSVFNRFICQNPKYLAAIHHVPARKPDATTLQLSLPCHVSDVKWATDYPGCKLLIELDPFTFTSEEYAYAYRHPPLRNITKGDMIIFNEYNPGFVYEYTRILGVKDDHCHIEIVAFDLDGSYFSEASSVFFPCVVAIPTHLIDLDTFYVDAMQSSTFPTSL